MSELRDSDSPRQRSARPGVPRERADVVKKARGQWRDEVWRRDPETGEVRLEQAADAWDHNLIVASFTELLAGLLANEPTFLGGILQHAQGRGDASWDVQLPNPSFNDTTLFDEYFRKAPDSITFVDENGDPSAGVTNSILIRTEFDFDEANGAGGRASSSGSRGSSGGPPRARRTRG